MNRAVLLIIVALVHSPAFSNEPDWPMLASLVMAYADNPSPKNAQSIIEAIPEKHVPYVTSGAKSDALDIIYASGPMAALKSQVSIAEPISVALGFRMLNISDGAFTEDLDVILGKLINIDPELFLYGLEKVDPVYISGLVGNFGEGYVDELEKSCKESNRRVKSLSGVNVADLERIRMHAIEFLENRAGLYCNDT